MPQDSTPKQRQSWPKKWLDRFGMQQEQVEEKAEQLSSFMNRPMREDLDKALELLGLPPWTNFRCEDYMEQLKAARTKSFKNLMVKYSLDKSGRPESDNENPANVRSTPV